MPPVVLSQQDQKILAEVIRRERNRYGNTPFQRNREYQTESPETYLARVPAGGIAGLTQDSGTGSYTEDTPGYAECDIYKIAQTDSGYVTQALGTTALVFNMTANDLEEDSWTPIVKDKFGTWLATQSPSSGGAAAFSGARVNGDISANSALTLPAKLIFLTPTPTINKTWYDEGGYFDISDPERLTAPEDGWYHVGGKSRVVTQATIQGGALRLCRSIPSTGSVDIPISDSELEIEYGVGSGTDYIYRMAMMISCDTWLFAGDYVTLTLTGDTLGDGVSSYNSEMWIHQIGKP